MLADAESPKFPIEIFVELSEFANHRASLRTELLAGRSLIELALNGILFKEKPSILSRVVFRDFVRIRCCLPGSIILSSLLA